ncbi:MAG: tetratricopeptide repeat protein [Acidobacteria bacterium]|nr:tetratricopeptide repeat protein [Acidobacteriota bacterium]
MENDSEDRLDQFRQLVEADPGDSLAWYGLGCECLKAQRFEEAAAAFYKVVELDANHSAAHRHLGYALLRAGDFDAARAAFQRGIPIARQNGDLQTVKEMQALLNKLEKKPGQDGPEAGG